MRNSGGEDSGKTVRGEEGLETGPGRGARNEAAARAGGGPETQAGGDGGVSVPQLREPTYRLKGGKMPHSCSLKANHLEEVGNLH